MTGPFAARSVCGTRLHLQHGPIDLILKADGERERAFAAAQARFATILAELAAELPLLRAPLTPDSPCPSGVVARRMDSAARRFADCGFLTRMAAVAGSVADEVLAAMTGGASLSRAMVNNGGDIAVHLTEGTGYVTGMQTVAGAGLGRLVLRGGDGIGGIATSGRHGRSFSLGIADSVTVLAHSGAMADTAATLIANAVDLPGHPAISRKPAHSLAPDSDLGALPVVTGCAMLGPADRARALAAGLSRAETFLRDGRIAGAALFLHGEVRICGAAHPTSREIEHA